MIRAEAIARMRHLADRRAEIEAADQDRNHRVRLAAQAADRCALATAIAIGSDEPADDAIEALEAAVIDYHRAVSDGGTP